MSKLLARLSDPARSGVYHAPTGAEVLDAARGSSLDVARVDLAGARDKAALLGAFASALAFPAWFGGNWDALEDCLCDLSWRRGAGRVLLVGGAGAVPRDELGVLRDVLQSAAEFWSGRGTPFFAVFIGEGGPAGLPALFRERGGR